MSTNKTTNYQLHSWVPQDDFHVSEINENFALLDTALKSEAGSAAQKQAALETAIGQRLRIATGSYHGSVSVTLDTPQRIELGFKPRIILLSSGVGFSDSSNNPYGGLITEDYDMRGSVIMDDTGFTVRNIYDYRTRPNSETKVYHYIVFY